MPTAVPGFLDALREHEKAHHARDIKIERRLARIEGRLEMVLWVLGGLAGLMVVINLFELERLIS